MLGNTSLIKYPDEEIKLTSWNVNSLGDRKKNKNIFNKLNKECSNNVVLLDTRTSSETEHHYQKATAHKLYFNSLRSDARGVTILVKDSCPITNITSTAIIPGNLTKFNFTYKDEKWTIAALYAPNKKDLHFFHTLFESELYTTLITHYTQQIGMSPYHNKWTLTPICLKVTSKIETW